MSRPNFPQSRHGPINGPGSDYGAVPIMAGGQITAGGGAPLVPSDVLLNAASSQRNGHNSGFFFLPMWLVLEGFETALYRQYQPQYPTNDIPGRNRTSTSKRGGGGTQGWHNGWHNTQSAPGKNTWAFLYANGL